MEILELTKLAAPLGVGGILAAVMFFFYRQDAKECAEAREKAAQLYADEWKGQSQMLMQVVKENTAAITALTARLEREESAR